MSKRKKYYVAYGSNLNRAQMAVRCTAAQIAGTSVLEGWRLQFRGERNYAVATVEPCKGASVPVLVWEITPADEAALDRYEGFPVLYRKDTVTVPLNGKPVRAMIYVMNEGRPPGEPSAYYYSTILEGYNDSFFDSQTLLKAVLDSK